MTDVAVSEPNTVGRDEKGRNLPGHALNPRGNRLFHGNNLQRFRHELTEAMDPETVKDIVLKMREAALAGDMETGRYLLDRLLGQRWDIPDPTEDEQGTQELIRTVVMQEFKPTRDPNKPRLGAVRANPVEVEVKDETP